MEEKEGSPWSLALMWNEALDRTEEREIVERDRMYASELGRSDVDIFLKMKGTVPSNPPNSRAFRKMHAGDLYEWFVFLVLKKCGILIHRQTPVKTQIEGCVPVSGKLDYLAGGKIDFDKGQQKIDELIEELELPPLFRQITEHLIAILKEKYPDGLQEKIIEIKSTAIYGYEKVEKTGKCLAGHDIQEFHYSHGLQIEGSLCYISRDDLRMYEIPILPNDQRLLERYENKIKSVSGYYLADQMPEPEKPVLYDNDLQKFSKNFNVEYSPFLTKLYGIEIPDEYDKIFGPLVKRWNSVLNRLKKQKTMTKKNDEVISEIRSYGFPVDEIIGNLKLSTEETPEDEEI